MDSVEVSLCIIYLRWFKFPSLFLIINFPKRMMLPHDDVACNISLFLLSGNKAMQSKVYSEAIELYTFAIALFGDNEVYYGNRFCNTMLIYCDLGFVIPC